MKTDGAFRCGWATALVVVSFLLVANDRNPNLNWLQTEKRIYDSSFKADITRHG